jgi:hypothetical protein
VPLCSVVIYALIGSELFAGRPRVGFEEDITKHGCHWSTVTTRNVVTSIARLLEGYATVVAQCLPANRMVFDFPGSSSSEARTFDWTEKMMFCDTPVPPDEPWCFKLYST